jgi:lysophospholipase L1-like esterase
MSMTRPFLLPCTLAALAAATACSKASSPTAPSGPITPGSTVYYTAVGASDAIGYGSSVVCAPYAVNCTNGMGYVQVVVRELEAQKSTVTLTNLGLPGAVIGPDFVTLGTQYGLLFPGDFIDSEMPFVPRNSTVVTIFAGANDVDTVMAAIDGGAGGSNPVGFAAQEINAFGTDYATLLSGIRSRAPSAYLVAINLPNFAAIPMTSGYSLERKQFVQKLSVGFDLQVINPLASQGVVVIDLLCDSRFTNPAIFSSDGFHPNDTGYAILASMVMQALTTTNYPAPVGTCGQMQVVPPI